jgi:hypothetical protein
LQCPAGGAGAAIERALLRRGGIREDRNATLRVPPDKLTNASEPSLGSSPDSAEGVLRGWAALFMDRTLATGFTTKRHTLVLVLFYSLFAPQDQEKQNKA